MSRIACRLGAVLALLLTAFSAGAQHRVLFIGNSFTIGSGGGGVPGIFDRLAQAGGNPDPTTVMQAVGGTDYQFHNSDPAAQAAISSQPWTHVILQNYSTEPTHLVGGSHSLADHFTYGTELYKKIMANHPQTQVILFETWSRAANHPLITGVSSPSSFASTAEFQAELRTNYNLLATLLNSNFPANPPVRVGPVGDAWENAGGLRAESDPAFTDLHGSDNYHGNNNGYYLAAAVFYSVIYGQSPEGLSTSPLVSGLNLGLTEPPAYLERIAWETVSRSASPQVQSWLIDFGSATTTTEAGPAPDDPERRWNNVADIGIVSGGTLAGLVTVDGQPSAAGLTIVDRFNGVNTAGTTASTAFPADATRDSLFGNTELFNGLTDIYPSFKLTGLSTGLTYALTFYASRTGVNDNRETTYSLDGATSASATLDAANNVDAVATAPAIHPDANGEITVSLSPGPGNNDGNHFTYLGALGVRGFPPQEPVVITGQPLSQTIVEQNPVTFSVTVSGTPPYFAQWFSNDVAIPGATALSYSIPLVQLSMDGSIFSVVVSNLVYSTVSSNAVLSVSGDPFPPAVVSAETLDGRNIDVLFNEPMDPAGAGDPANFMVNGGSVPVISATLQPDGRTIRLVLANGILGAFTVAVSGVQDLAGNFVAAGTVVNGFVEDVATQPLLIDFGGGSTTINGPSPDDPENHWNNVTSTIGASSSAQLNNLVTAANNPTAISLVMLSRFNGANESGTTAATLFPMDATRDSLFGNTETFSGLANIFPSFKLTGLNPGSPHRLIFYASRTGVGDNRETAYTVIGSSTNTTVLNPANNVTNVAVIAGVLPDASGEITISLSPTASNNNANHFTYLGALRIEPGRPAASLRAPTLDGGDVMVSWDGTGTLEWAPTPDGPWTRLDPAPTSPYRDPMQGGNRFYRVTVP